jgi:hypothetical protein
LHPTTRLHQQDLLVSMPDQHVRSVFTRSAFALVGTRLNRQKYGETPEEYEAMRKARGYNTSRVAPAGLGRGGGGSAAVRLQTQAAALVESISHVHSPPSFFFFILLPLSLCIFLYVLALVAPFSAVVVGLAL